MNDNNKARIPVYILAGGHSSRFGSDKARALVGQRPLIAHVAGQLDRFASSLTVVADQGDKYQDLGLCTIADREPRLGPLGGLLTALEHAADAQWLLVTACDTVILDETLVDRLLEGRQSGIGVVGFKGEYWETMPALYHVSILGQVRASLKDNQRSVWRLIESVPHKMLRYSTDQAGFARINSPEDLARFHSMQRSAL